MAVPCGNAAVAIGDQRPYNTALFVLDPDAVATFAAKAGLRNVSAAELASSRNWCP